MKKKIIPLVITLILLSISTKSQHSIARQWNEQLLEAIRNDFARPTVHARNLFHSSILMYDAWAIFNDTAETVFLGNYLGKFHTKYIPITIPQNKENATKEIISFALFRLLSHRFKNSPNATETLSNLQTFFNSLGYDKTFVSTDYSSGSYAALGNYMAEKMIEFGLQDGANEKNGYKNRYYETVNSDLILDLYENNDNIDPNRWQPLAFNVFIDQSGNNFPSETPDFLSPEWGEVIPFALENENLEILNNGFDSYVYNNPGPPVYIQESDGNGIEDPYKWNFSLVISWSAHLDPSDDVFIDISPGKIGNSELANFPTTFKEYKEFYNFIDGGDSGTGHKINPTTLKPYDENIVKRADYARVLAEFWADGPDSETPPGHWFTILNYVSDHPLSKKTFGSSTIELTNLEWDIKSYLVLAGAMHDSAINTWGIKGYYDYIRPISAIRYMASKGQSTNTKLANYNAHGLPLIDNLIEVIEEGDNLAGFDNRNIGRIKIKSWKGPDFINNPDTDLAGVGWMIGTHWWPYQRPSFVTPPFAGYLSGHSTFSRAASEVLTLITNNAFFPGGLGTFDVKKNEFLVFEEGPTENFTLQWATYRDASDQTSLSRIWGGIHPPIDDIKGRIIGNKIGKQAYEYAKKLFNGTVIKNSNNKEFNVFPNPTKNNLYISTNDTSNYNVEISNTLGKKINSIINLKTNFIDVSNLSPGVYFVKISSDDKTVFLQKIIIE